jgi:hypothetical protein
MKLKNTNIDSSKKISPLVRKFSTADEALKSKHDLARDFFKNIALPK